MAVAALRGFPIGWGAWLQIESFGLLVIRDGQEHGYGALFGHDEIRPGENPLGYGAKTWWARCDGLFRQSGEIEMRLTAAYAPHIVSAIRERFRLPMGQPPITQPQAPFGGFTGVVPRRVGTVNDSFRVLDPAPWWPVKDPNIYLASTYLVLRVEEGIAV